MMRLAVNTVLWLTVWLGGMMLTAVYTLRYMTFGQAVVTCMLVALMSPILLLPLERVASQEIRRSKGSL